ncbi:MAG: polysaccharide deacetylase [Proteobacteria bacterium]|nr:MAG: polysaccharide deacetylase [Pseudomonadota bacterium]PIE69568.1 MAG: polysaccharide deacetylase [Deltaproteobacteria bacterium]
MRVERNTHRILDLLDEVKKVSGSRPQKPIDQNQKINEPNNPANQSNQSNPQTNKTAINATFFVLGWIARRCPQLVKEIHARGHEVASHGFNHHLCTAESAFALTTDLIDSKALLEDMTGSEVTGYRAPSFSVNDDILKRIEDAGYRYDSSYNSFDKHGRYGKLNLAGKPKQGMAYKISDNLFELPISNLLIQNSKFNTQNWILPWGGGGYFRLIPYFIFKKGIWRILSVEHAYNFYLHPWEVDPNQPRVKDAPASFKFRHYINLASTAGKIRKMLQNFGNCRFVTCGEYVSKLSTRSAGGR